MGQPFDYSGTRFDRRRFIVSAGALAAVGFGEAVGAPAVASAHGRPSRPVPEPIPGGLPVPGGPGLDPPIHIFLPGDTTTTLPLSGLPLQGLDVEPALITDLKAATAMAYILGTARGSDGVDYGLEVDVRVSEGLYRAADGSDHYGTFALL
jgi:hypothetical protein